LLIFYFLLWQLQMFSSVWFWNVHTNNSLHSLYMRYVSSGVLHFLPCKEILSCMFYLKDYQLQWISFWLNQFIRKTGQKHWNRL
jgi:hypothetical protein